MATTASNPLAQLGSRRSLVGAPAAQPPPPQPQPQPVPVPARAAAGDVLSQFTPVSVQSDEFRRIEYYLQMSLQSVAVRVKRMLSIANPHLTIQFEQRTRDSLQLDAWVELSRLAYNKPVHDLAQNGFELGPRGMIFSVGAVQLRDFGTATDRQRTHQLVLSRIGVAKSFCIAKSTLMQHQQSSQEPLTLPPGFDSFYIADDVSSSSDGSAPRYQYQYLLQDAELALPMYLVEFDFDPKDELGARHVLDDNAVSSTEEIRRRFYSRDRGFGPCPTHGEPVEFYDPKLRVPVCMHCKMEGSHSIGEAASHKLVRVDVAYRDAVQASMLEDPMLGSRRSAVRDQLTSVADSLVAVKRNHNEAEERVFQLLQAALQTLQAETDKKVGMLASVEVELRRQLEHMSWMESFLRYQRESLTPLEFLENWDKHVKMRSDVHTMRDMRDMMHVEADIEVEGQVEITTSEERARRASAAAAAALQASMAWDNQSMISGQPNNVTGLTAVAGAPNVNQSFSAPPPPPPIGSTPAAVATPGSHWARATTALQAVQRMSHFGSPAGLVSPGTAVDQYTAAAAASAPGSYAALGAAARGLDVGASYAGAIPPPAAAASGSVPQPFSEAQQLVDLETSLRPPKATKAIWLDALRRRKNESATRRRYEELGAVLTVPDLSLALTISDATPMADLDDVARAMLRLFSCASVSSLPFIRAVTRREVEKTPQAPVLFRMSSFASKLLYAYAAMVGLPYIRQSLGPMINWVCENTTLSLEVDPTRARNENVRDNLVNLRNSAKMFMEKLMQSFNLLPVQMRIVCNLVAAETSPKFPGTELAAVANVFFLRFVCPAIMMPDAYGVTEVVPSDKARRNLTLIAKLLQKLASGTTFKKEDYMTELNKFVTANWESMKQFLERLSSGASLPAPESVPPFPVTEQEKDDALVIMHRFLVQNVEGVKRAQDTMGDAVDTSVLAQYCEHLWNVVGALGVPPEKPASYEAPLPGSQAMASMTA